jgi:hypothetical protein
MRHDYSPPMLILSATYDYDYEKSIVHASSVTLVVPCHTISVLAFRSSICILFFHDLAG